jgi:hypothetical protein
LWGRSEGHSACEYATLTPLQKFHDLCDSGLCCSILLPTVVLIRIAVRCTRVTICIRRDVSNWPFCAQSHRNLCSLPPTRSHSFVVPDHAGSCSPPPCHTPYLVPVPTEDDRDFKQPRMPRPAVQAWPRK